MSAESQSLLSGTELNQLTAQDLSFILSGEFGPRTCPCSHCVALSKKIHALISGRSTESGVPK